MKQLLICLLICLTLSTSVYANLALDRGLAAAESSQWDIALAAFNDAWEEEPLSPVVFYNLGLANAKAGNPVPAVAWLEAYLAALPSATNGKQVRIVIAKLEVQAEIEMNKLFERALGVLAALPLDNNVRQRDVKWTEAKSISHSHAAVGKIKEAYRVAALSRKFYDQIGGAKGGYDQPPEKTDLDVTYARSLAETGNFTEAMKQARKAGGEDALNGVREEMIRGPFTNGTYFRQGLENFQEAPSYYTIATVGRKFWLQGDVEGLKFLGAWLKDKGAEYNPARVEVAHALLGLGYEEEAKGVALASKRDDEHAAARFILRMLYENPDLNSVVCYERVTGSSTLWRMLMGRHYALKGNAARTKAETWIPMHEARTRSHNVTYTMKYNHAWAVAFDHYAAKDIVKAKQAMMDAGLDVQSFLIIALRNAATRDPLYAAAIAAAMDSTHLGPFLLKETADQAMVDGKKGVARILQFEAEKLAVRRGGRKEMFSRNMMIQSWIDLALLYKNNRTLSGLDDALKLLADGGDVPFEWMKEKPPFVDEDHNYRCPEDWLRPPRSAQDPVSPVPVKGVKDWSGSKDLGRAGSYIGQALLQIRATRKKTIIAE